MVANGRLTDLGTVAGYKLRADLVPQTAAMIAAAARDGVTLQITQAYRTYAQQVDLFLDRYTPRTTGTGPYGDVRFWDGGDGGPLVRYVRTSGAAAAVPGTSNHGLGQAIDFATDSPGAISWLMNNAAPYGWARPAWTYKAPTIEPWHWEASRVVEVSNPLPGGGGSVPTVPNTPPIGDIDVTMTPEQDSRLKNVESILGNLQNAIGDPNNGIAVNANGARANAANAANIASDVRNAIADPTAGLRVKLDAVKSDTAVIKGGVASLLEQPAAGAPAAGDATVVLTDAQLDAIADRVAARLYNGPEA